VAGSGELVCSFMLLVGVVRDRRSWSDGNTFTHGCARDNKDLFVLWHAVGTEPHFVRTLVYAPSRLPPRPSRFH
jgi:hypothetical protein